MATGSGGDGGVRSVVIVGAGLAGLRTSEALRRAGFAGRLVLVGDEPHPPYDRPPLTKEILDGSRPSESCELASSEQLEAIGVELLTSCGETRLHLDDRRLETERDEFHFDRLVVATGARARQLPGADLIEGVHTVRTLADSRAVARLMGSVARLHVVGAGLIGCEVASSARAGGLEVTLIEPAEAPMLRAAGPQFAAVFRDLHEAAGVDLRCGVGVAGLNGGPGLESVTLSDGETISTRHLVLGIGAAPATGWLQGSGIEVEDGVLCDATLTSSHPDVMAVGDVARFSDSATGGTRRSEQWTNAIEQARHVAANLLLPHSERLPFRGSDYFWSRQFGHMIQGVGRLDRGEIELLDGSFADRAFLAVARDGETVLGALSVDRPKEFAAVKRELSLAASTD